MIRPTRKLLIVAAVLLGLGLFAAAPVQAGWWHGGYYGYYGCTWDCCAPTCYTPCYTPVCAPVCSVSVCDPCCGGWYLGVRPGPIRRALFGPYRWYRSYGCCSICACDPCCCYDACCYDPCCVSDATTTVEPSADVHSSQRPTLAPTTEPAPAPAAGTPNAPTMAPAPAEMPAPAATPATPAMPGPEPAAPSGGLTLPPPSAPQTSVRSPGEGTISILVPEGAEVTINGYVTKSTGRVRRYVAQNLKAGLVYPFEIQVKVVRNGQTLTDSRQVKLTGGALEAVVFNFDKTSVERLAQAW